MFCQQHSGRPIAILAFFAIAGGALTAQAATAPTRCLEVSVPVSIADGESIDYQVSGDLCWVGRLGEHETIQVLLHGITYDRFYWDPTVNTRKNSYVNHATRRGFTVLNLDRIGAGESDRPPGELVTAASNAWVVHQVVEDLREGNIADVSFDRVVLVGHSYGSLVSTLVATWYPDDADAVILTGVSHELTPTAAMILSANLIPAVSDPVFAGSGMPLSYLTLATGIHAALFNPSNADPDLITVDETAKDTVTTGEIDDLGLLFEPISLGLTVPTLMVIGDSDAIFCGNLVDCSTPETVLDYEAPFFSEAAALEVIVQRNSNHILTLHKNARSSYRQMTRWLRRQLDGDC